MTWSRGARTLPLTLSPRCLFRVYAKCIWLDEVHYLYKYCCLLEMFKIIKLRIPIALYSIFTRSNRRENYFITNTPSTSFINQSSHMWNKCYRVSESTNIDFSSAVARFKKIIKFALLSTQKLYETNIWCLSNYDIIVYKIPYRRARGWPGGCL